MGVLSVARLFACRALWGAGMDSAGRCLLTALGSPQEDVRTIAGMFLVQAGRRAEPLVKQGLERGEYLPTLLTIAGDLGLPSLTPQIQRLTTHTDPLVARAARDALDIMALQNSDAPGSD
jgi:hypothetical protein